MSFGKIGNMYEISFAGPIGSWIIRSEDLKGRSLSRGRIDRERNEMGFGEMLLDKIPGCIGATCIEVTKNHISKPKSRCRIL